MQLNTENEYSYFSILKILSETFQYISENRSSIFHCLKYPGIGILLLSFIAKEEFILIDIPLFILEIYLYFIFVVRCHRLFLLNESPNSFKESLHWNKRNTIFMFTSFALAIGLGVLSMPIIFFSTSMGDLSFLQSDTSMLMVLITAIPIGYLFSRLSLVFPAIAIDKHNDFQYAWTISKGNGWKLFILISAIPITTSFLISTISVGLFLFKLISALFGVLFLMIEVIILSSSYKVLELINIKPNQALNIDSKTSAEL